MCIDCIIYRSKKKSVRFAIDEDDAGEGDESEDEAEDEQEMEQGPVLLGEAEQPEEPTTNLKKSLKKVGYFDPLLWLYSLKLQFSAETNHREVGAGESRSPFMAAERRSDRAAT